MLEQNSQLTIKSLQKFQREYDARFVDEGFTGFDKVRHTYAHLGKLFGRLAEYVQKVEDGDPKFSPEEIKQKVIPDLLVYAAWLSHEFGVDMEEAYLKRIVENIKRVHGDKISPQELAELENYVNARLKE